MKEIYKKQYKRMLSAFEEFSKLYRTPLKYGETFIRIKCPFQCRYDPYYLEVIFFLYEGEYPLNEIEKILSQIRVFLLQFHDIERVSFVRWIK